MKKGINWKKGLLLSFVTGCLMAAPAMAAEPGTVVSSEVDGEQLVLYVQNPGEIESIECQIGTTPAEAVSYGPISGLEVPASTLLLLDNSLSVSSRYRPMINEIMTNLAANRMAGEQFTVATFSDTITCLLEDSSDYAQVKQTLDGISYHDQETYLTDVLYEVLAGWEQNPEPGYKRIVIVSDGVDNKAIGYTKEELYDLLEEHPYPIYTIGCSYQSGNNNEALENMFALSRMTRSSYWLLDEVSDSMSVVSEIAVGNDVIRVAVDAPASVCDGTQKGVKLTMQVGGETKEASVVMDMPFGAAEVIPEEPETEEPETEAEPETEETEAGETVDAEAISQQKRKAAIYAIIAGFAALAAVAVAVVIVRVVKQRKEEERFVAAPEEAFHQSLEQSRQAGFPGDQTEMLGREFGEDTAMVWSGSKQGRTLVLIDQNYPGRRFETPLSGVVVIGRSQKDGCQVVLDYDKSVSRRHCQIRLDGSQLKIKDLGSRNKTFVNNNVVIGETGFGSGSVITLGNVKMKVELRG